MRKVTLSMNEQKKYEVIKSLTDHTSSNKRRAALTIGCSLRHINRMIKGYLKYGKVFFVHGNRGKKPANAILSHLRNRIVDLYKNKYSNANFKHFTELLDRYEDIHISPSSVRTILESQNILSPKVTKAKKKRFLKKLREEKKTAKSAMAAEKIQKNIDAIEDAHPRRPRSAYFGELEQMDASPYEWIPGCIWHLHLAIDDATGTVTGAYFDTQETLNAYYHVFYRILTTYGIPYKFLTDRRTIFTYKKKNSPSVDEDTYTQFAYACKQLGVELEATSVPQAKGRVERLNQTLQSRLPVELKLAGVTTIDEANEFLNSYIKEFNEKFALPVHNTKSVFVEQPENEKINLILAVLCEHTVDAGHCLRHANKYYRMLDINGTPVYYRQGTKVLFIHAFDGRKFCSVNDNDMYVLEEVPFRETRSKNLNADYVPTKTEKKYIPPMSHPWKKHSFEMFVKKQKHRWNYVESA